VEGEHGTLRSTVTGKDGTPCGTVGDRQKNMGSHKEQPDCDRCGMEHGQDPPEAPKGPDNKRKPKGGT
jgi:hypothetical protein